MLFGIGEPARNSGILLPLLSKHGHQSRPNLVASAGHGAHYADVLIGILINNSRLSDVSARIGDLRSHMDSRFDDMRANWQSELHRVEEVLDARLKHLEER